MLDGLHAISSGAFHQRLNSPSSYAAFILLRPMCCLNTGASPFMENISKKNFLSSIIWKHLYFSIILSIYKKWVTRIFIQLHQTEDTFFDLYLIYYTSPRFSANVKLTKKLMSVFKSRENFNSNLFSLI